MPPTPTPNTSSTLSPPSASPPEPVLRATLPSTLPSELFFEKDLAATLPAGMSLPEWKARVELACIYRVFYARGWDEEIINHITLRVPGPEAHFLINPFGLYYGEVTALNLVKIDVEGREIEPSPFTVNRAGFVIHSAVHAARPYDAHCVIHTHSTPGVAVACKEEGLRLDNFYSIFLHGQVAYHPFEGVTVRMGEQERLIANLGAKSVLILQNHGLLVTGPSTARAFFTYYALHRACEIQCTTQAMPGPNIPISDEVAREGLRGAEGADPEGALCWKIFAGAVRRAGIRKVEDVM